MAKSRIYFYQALFCLAMTIVMGITAGRLHPHGIHNLFGVLALIFVFGMVFMYVAFYQEIDKRSDKEQ